MNAHERTRNQFLLWFEQRLAPDKRMKVERHLLDCIACRAWFEASTELLGTPSVHARTLEPDPFLPTRIRALAERDGQRTHAGFRPAVRWAAGTVAVAAALLIGVYLGDGITRTQSTITDQEIVDQYARSVAMAGINDRWQSVAETTGGKAK